MKSFAIILLATFAFADDAKKARSERYSTEDKQEMYPNFTAPSYKNLDKAPRHDYNTFSDEKSTLPPYLHEAVHNFSFDAKVFGEAGY